MQGTEGPSRQMLTNQVMGLFDRAPVATAVTDGEQMIVRNVNPAFAEILDSSRDRLRGRPLLDLTAPADPRAARRLVAALVRGEHTRHRLEVSWTARRRRYFGRLSAELADSALSGDLPLLVFLQADREGPAPASDVGLDAVARRILAAVAGGATTAATARTVGLTVDGVNYHLTRMCRRLHVPNRTALVARAYVLGLLDAGTWPPAGR